MQVAGHSASVLDASRSFSSVLGQLLELSVSSPQTSNTPVTRLHDKQQAALKQKRDEKEAAAKKAAEAAAAAAKAKAEARGSRPAGARLPWGSRRPGGW